MEATPDLSSEPVVTPAVLQAREKAKLERKNAKGQLELSIENVDDAFRPIFSYKWFNAVQSKAFDDVSVIFSSPYQ